MVGFPSNQFTFLEELGTNNQVANRIRNSFDPPFTVTRKVNVNGCCIHPLWHFLKKETDCEYFFRFIRWNYTKFLIGRDGIPRKRYGIGEGEPQMKDLIEALLAEDDPNAPAGEVVGAGDEGVTQ